MKDSLEPVGREPLLLGMSLKMPSGGRWTGQLGSLLHARYVELYLVEDDCLSC